MKRALAALALGACTAHPAPAPQRQTAFIPAARDDGGIVFDTAAEDVSRRMAGALEVYRYSRLLFGVDQHGQLYVEAGVTPRDIAEAFIDETKRLAHKGDECQAALNECERWMYQIKSVEPRTHVLLTGIP